MAGGESTAAAETAAVTTPQPAFVYTGHGNETPIPYEERQRVPPGHTVVLFSEPGLPVPAHIAESIWEEMVKNPALFLDPITNKRAIERNIGKKIRIYGADTPLPSMNYFPFSGMVSGNNVRFYPGGIYPIPPPFPKFEPTETNAYKITSEFLGERYSGPLNTPILAALLALPQRSANAYDHTTLNSLVYPIKRAMSFTGPGIHYFLNCRFVKGIRDSMLGIVNPLVTELEQAYKQKMIELDRRWEKQKDNDYLYSGERDRKENLRNIIYHNHESISYDLKKIYDEIQQFKALANEIQAAEIPERVLDKLKHALVAGSFTEDELAMLRSGELANPLDNSTNWNPYTNEELNAEEQIHGTFSYILIRLHRRYYQLYKHRFEPLRAQLKLTRTASNLHQQTTYPNTRRRKARKGGRRSLRTRRRTLKNRRRR